MTLIDNKPVYADIALNLPIPDLFTYLIPDKFVDTVTKGTRVLVPFRNKKQIGIVVELKNTTDFENTKPIIRPLELYPALDNELMELARWVSDYYLCPLGEAIHAAAPPSSRGNIVALYIVAAEMAKRVFYSRLNQAHTSAPANKSSIQSTGTRYLGM